MTKRPTDHTLQDVGDGRLEARSLAGSVERPDGSKRLPKFRILSVGPLNALYSMGLSDRRSMRGTAGELFATRGGRPRPVWVMGSDGGLASPRLPLADREQPSCGWEAWPRHPVLVGSTLGRLATPQPLSRRPARRGAVGFACGDAAGFAYRGEGGSLGHAGHGCGRRPSWRRSPALRRTGRPSAAPPRGGMPLEVTVVNTSVAAPEEGTVSGIDTQTLVVVGCLGLT